MFLISEEQATEIALTIYKDVIAWAAARRESDEARLSREFEEEDAYTDEDAKALGA